MLDRFNEFEIKIFLILLCAVALIMRLMCRFGIHKFDSYKWEIHKMDAIYPEIAIGSPALNLRICRLVKRCIRSQCDIFKIK